MGEKGAHAENTCCRILSVTSSGFLPLSNVWLVSIVMTLMEGREESGAMASMRYLLIHMEQDTDHTDQPN